MCLNLSSLRAKLESDTKPNFSLSHFLYIYYQSKPESSQDYMRGAKALYLYLTDNNTRTLEIDLEVKTDYRLLNNNYPLDIFSSWETSELAKILETKGCSNHTRFVNTYYFSKAVILTLYEKVIPLIYKRQS